MAPPRGQELGKDEIRLIALGTGMPSARRSQAATCWLVVAIHEAFLTPQQLVTLYSQAPLSALGVGTYVHTPPQAFGKIMSTVKPRHAIAYHFFNESDTRDQIYGLIRQTYDGPLTLAEDMLVWNITKGDITVRTAVSSDEAWSVAGPTAAPPPDRTVPDQLT